MQAEVEADRRPPLVLVRVYDSKQASPVATSSAPPPPLQGLCCTNAVVLSRLATWGVYPMDTESPMTMTEGSAVWFAGDCAPGGQT